MAINQVSDERTHAFNIFCVQPQTEEIGLQITSTTKISTSFHRNALNFHTSFHGSPKHFEHFFAAVYGSPRHSKEWPGKPANVEIQIFKSDLLRERSLMSSISFELHFFRDE